MNACQKVSGGLLVAGGDTPKVLQAAEEALDPVTLLVQFLVVSRRVLPIAARRDHRGLAGCLENGAYPFVGIVALVADQSLCLYVSG